MNLQSPMATALLRGTYWALGSGALIFLTTYGTTDELKASLISGGIAALGALGFRGAEGKYDARRQASGNVKPSDVGQ
jgi:uncharacterized membrane protein YebE (DUF533 family)